MSSIFGDSSSTSAAIDGSVQALGTGAVAWSGVVRTTMTGEGSLSATFDPALPDGELTLRLAGDRDAFKVTSATLTPTTLSVTWTRQYHDGVNRVFDEEIHPYFDVLLDGQAITSFPISGRGVYSLDGAVVNGVVTQSYFQNPLVNFPLNADLLDTADRGLSLALVGTTAFGNEAIEAAADGVTLTVDHPGHHDGNLTVCCYLRGPPALGTSYVRQGSAIAFAECRLEAPTANTMCETSLEFTSASNQLDEDNRDQWKHVALVQDEANTQIFVDHTLVHTRSLAGEKRLSLFYPTKIGLAQYGAAAHLGVWPRALDASERLTHAESWRGVVVRRTWLLDGDLLEVDGAAAALQPTAGDYLMTSGYLEMQSTSTLHLGLNEMPDMLGGDRFSLAAWVYRPNDQDSVRMWLLEDGVTDFTFEIIAGQLRSELGATAFQDLAGPAHGGWHHVAQTVDGTVSKIYIDGVLVSTAALPATFTPLLSIIGHRFATMPAGVRLYAMSIARGIIHVPTVMNSYTPEQALAPFASWPMTANLTDDVGSYAFTVSTGTATHTNGYADLSSGLVMTAPVPTQTMTTFGFSAWVFVDDVSGSFKLEWRNAGSKVVHFYLYRNGVGNTAFGFDITGQSGNLYDRVDVLPLNTWYHIAWSYTVGGNMEAWLNKVSLGAEAMSATAVGDVNEIYVSTPPSGGPFKCAAVRFYTDGALTQTDVDSDYDLFTPPP